MPRQRPRCSRNSRVAAGALALRARPRLRLLLAALLALPAGLNAGPAEKDRAAGAGLFADAPARAAELLRELRVRPAAGAPLSVDAAPAPSGYDPRALVGLLDRIAELERRGETPVVIFDLDDTLLDSSPRKAGILAAFIARKDIQDEFPVETKLVAEFLEHPVWRYSLEETVRAAGATDPAFLAGLKKSACSFFWGKLLLEDVAMPGAPAYVSSVRERGAVVVYLTGRLEYLRAATSANLEKNGFPAPDGGRTRLLMKRRSGQNSMAFKEAELESIAAIGTVAGGFDNEPGNINAFKERFPDALMIFPDTLRSSTPDPRTGRPYEVLPGIPWIKNFNPP